MEHYRERSASPAARTAAFVALALLAAAAGSISRAPLFASQPAAAEPEEVLETLRPAGRAGGRLVVALRAQPKTFNPVLALDGPSLTVIRRMVADLVHINRQTQRTEPALAKSWTISPDGRRLGVELRRGIRFSDGRPFGVEDVLFTFKVHLDEKLASPSRHFLIVGGEPIAVRKVGSHSLEFELAQPYAVGERLFDSIAVLPRHLLAKAYAEGTLSSAWGLATPAAEIAGLGPFRLKRYVPGERLELERNPYYWKVDTRGQRLPYLDEIVFLFVASEDAQAIRFQAGDTQVIDRLTAENFTLLERHQEARGYRLEDLGAGLNYEFLFFNMNDIPAGKLPEIRRKQGWFHRLAFRRAVSAAIDRAGIVRLVYQGRATAIGTHVTPGNKLWRNAAVAVPERSLETARRHLRSAGFSWDGEGRLHDPAGDLVEFSIVTNASNGNRVRMGTIIQEDLKQIGMRVALVPLEFRALVERVLRSHDYEACILGLGGADADPNPAMNLLMTSGSSHFWRLAQSAPPEPWEAEIDRLMQQQLTVLDPARRKRLYDRVQELVAEMVPMIFLVSPNILVGARRGLGNFAPAIIDHHTLWNADELFWRPDPSPSGR